MTLTCVYDLLSWPPAQDTGVRGWSVYGGNKAINWALSLFCIPCADPLGRCRRGRFHKEWILRWSIGNCIFHQAKHNIRVTDSHRHSSAEEECRPSERYHTPRKDFNDILNHSDKLKQTNIQNTTCPMIELEEYPLLIPSFCLVRFDIHLKTKCYNCGHSIKYLLPQTPFMDISLFRNVPFVSL